MTGALTSTGCFPSRGANNIALPVVTVTPASASVAAGSLVQFTATIVSPTSTTITWSVNSIAGGNSTVGTVSASGLYTAPAAVPSPATVTIKATSSAESYPFGAAIVTITAPPTTPVAIAPTDSSTTAGSSIQFTANTAVNWSVNGVAGGNGTVGTISAAGLYTAPTATPSPATVVVTATSQAATSQSASTTVTVTSSNSAPLFVNFGPNGNTGNPNTAHYNGLLTTVTVCLPGTNDCQLIPDVLVDTSSVGLRVLNSALTTVPATELTTIRDSHGNQMEECVQFADTSYVWGPVLFADVGLGGELAPSVPIQVIGDTTYPVPSSGCLSLGAGPSLDTAAALGANGILGIGTGVGALVTGGSVVPSPQDCGYNCAAGQTFPGYPYYVCPNNVCQTAALPVAQQVANPVAFFTADNNGVEISLPAIPAAGAPSLPYTSSQGTGLVPAGLLIFGIGTESNNGLGSATVYTLDGNGNFPTITFGGQSYTSAGILDSGANALYISNPQALGVLNCTDNPYYCPGLTESFPLAPAGLNGSAGTVTLNIANADTLLGTNPDFAAFDNLGGESGRGLSSDYFDLGLPFFFGRTVFVGIAGTTVPNSKVSNLNGYFAF
jgi:hypothetical protein